MLWPLFLVQTSMVLSSERLLEKGRVSKLTLDPSITNPEKQSFGAKNALFIYHITISTRRFDLARVAEPRL